MELRMGKTIRHTCEKWLRKPKANGARKGEVRPKALPPTSYDDLDVAGYDEDYSYKHSDKKLKDKGEKRLMKRMKKQGRDFRNKDNFSQMDDQ